MSGCQGKILFNTHSGRASAHRVLIKPPDLLASYMRNKDCGETLEAYLDNKVFGENKGTTVTPDKTDVDGFNRYMTRYKAAVAVEKAAIDRLK